MIETVVALVYCLIALYAFFRVGMEIGISKSKTKKKKALNIVLLIFIVFGLLVSAALLTEVAVHVIDPRTPFNLV